MLGVAPLAFFRGHKSARGVAERQLAGIGLPCAGPGGNRFLAFPRRAGGGVPGLASFLRKSGFYEASMDGNSFSYPPIAHKNCD